MQRCEGSNSHSSVMPLPVSPVTDAAANEGSEFVHKVAQQRNLMRSDLWSQSGE